MTRLAVVQMAMQPEREANVEKALQMVRQAASMGAQVVLLPELFESLYFCQVERETYFALAHPVEDHPFLPRFQALAQEFGLVLPVSFFERAGQAYYNSLALISPEGEIQGVYRKSHIPDGPGYEEKYYFNPGDTGFLAFTTPYGKVGAGICWDQWYPECARSLVLQGAEILLYPTAIGSEPPEAGGIDTKEMWQRAMIGHAVANLCYLAAANRVGTEVVEGHVQTYYGSSFIADYMGNKLAEAGRSEETILLAELDLEAARRFRAGFGFFRDRRPDLYGPLLTLDGRTRRPS
ncbi:N-carbamoylputrescine amidase [Meiothermus sp. QL-1]|uniref:N-carbamoylputrescine amidase n=1 Tax=Meiothermus sp. QL-1 TaxID=2058095 RepID=UPI000E0B91CB|nr:N-carbamoylputrescine amidase [Meiothermus sp. QL-1]RDI94566.1 N-carbamoylputrescine amidase [Meiothermus sp. QL-1]